MDFLFAHAANVAVLFLFVAGTCLLAAAVAISFIGPLVVAGAAIRGVRLNLKDLALHFASLSIFLLSLREYHFLLGTAFVSNLRCGSYLGFFIL